jgi:hypothetical protein
LRENRVDIAGVWVIVDVVSEAQGRASRVPVRW